jgi:hypothetical protein
MKNMAIALITFVGILTLVTPIHAQWEPRRPYIPYRTWEPPYSSSLLGFPDLRIDSIYVQEVCVPAAQGEWFFRAYARVRNFGGNRGLRRDSRMCISMEADPSSQTFQSSKCPLAPRAGESIVADLSIGDYYNLLPAQESYTLDRSKLIFTADINNQVYERSELNNSVELNGLQRERSLSCSQQ